MKISKLLCTLCALTFCAGFISVQAQDNPAQAAARAALDAKFQAAGTPPSANATPGILSDPQPATTVQEPSGSTTASGMDADAQTKAQAAAQAKISAQKQAAIAMKANAMALKAEQDAAKMDTNAQVKVQAAMQARAASDKANAAADQASAEAKKLDLLATQTKDEALKASQDATQLMATADTAAQISTEAQRQADTQKQAILAEQKRAAAEAQAQTATQREAAMAGAISPSQQPRLKPMEAPPLPISAAKQTQLDTLLDLYRADRISPSDYQKQRAAILAAP
jgi:hypothetical protein